MQNNAATFQCPNEYCKAANHESEKLCQQCGTPIVKRYLWAVGEGVEDVKIGEIVGERYWQKGTRIFVDTKPGLPPETPVAEIPRAVKPYLRLISYRLQVPQVYGLLSTGTRTTTEILLLEQAAIYPDGTPLAGQLMPDLICEWETATSLRQLNWLWQIAQLWQPLCTEGVGSSLLDPKLLRVEGSLVRLLELSSDRNATPILADLGKFWLQLVAKAQPDITEFLAQLCQSLVEGVPSTEYLVGLLERGISEIGRNQARTITISTYTDTGPSRQRNEDACYPPSKTTISTPTTAPLAIVCDGLGGHEGGNIASSLAIETIQQQVQQLPINHPDLDATTLSSEIERFARTANDKISQCNDQQNRYGRQRMGTTLVMALAHLHEIYIAHVGDSRAYWITRSGCHQVTLDDDVASREVRLGYALYRYALQQASSGSLVQALGMTSSSTTLFSASKSSLHPTVGRFILDEDSIFLLCSDGLSDFDRVEQYWQEVLPIFDGTDVASIVARLVEIGNTQNGHDNVTVGLVYCQVTPQQLNKALSASSLLQQVDYADTDKEIGVEDSDITVPVNAATADVKFAPLKQPEPVQTKVLPSKKRKRRSLLPILLGIGFLLTLGGGIAAYLFLPEISRRFNPVKSSSVIPPELPTSPVPLVNQSIPVVSVGTLIQIKSQITINQNQLSNSSAIAKPTAETSTVIVPAHSILEVVGKQENLRQGDLLKLRSLCLPSSTTPNPASNIKPQLRLGQEILIPQTKLNPANSEIVPTQGNICPPRILTTPVN